jgi:hypothetical protein
MAEEETRVLLVDRPCLVRDMIERAIRDAAGMRLVGVRERIEEPPRSGPGRPPEFVVVGLGDGGSLPPEAEDLLEACARRKVLGIESHDGRAFLYELRPARTALGEVTPEDVVAAIRAGSGG